MVEKPGESTVKKRFLDLKPGSAAWGHSAFQDGQGSEIHYVRMGSGLPVVMLHGWPGFWYDYRRVLPELAKAMDAIAVDLRGFGASQHPLLSLETGYSCNAQAAVVINLLEELQLEPAVLVGYDIGSAVAQAVARAKPERIRGLVLGAPLHPGSGAKALEPENQREFWYQDFQRLPLAVSLVANSRNSIRTYLSHFYEHWVGRREMLRQPEFDAIVETYCRPGAFDASLN